MNTIPKSTHEILYRTVEQLAVAIQRKEITCVELAQLFIARIAEVNPYINAVAQVDPERILLEAAQCDRDLHGGYVRGALHGIPVTIKDNLLTQNIITTGGSFAFKEHLPQEDATVVKRLKAAGAIILGKSNLPDFALSWETESTAYGRTNNPYHLNYSAGGSSGGEAAIIAAAGSPLGIGTDSGGSIRLPAHYCGIAGLRTSHGLIPSTGHMPPVEGLPVLGVFANFNAIGPMARSIRDLIYTLPILTGRDGIDPYADYPPLSKPKAFDIKKLKIAVYTTVQSQHIDPEIECHVKRVAHLFEDLGATVTQIEPPDLSKARDIYRNIVGADGGEGIRSLLSELGYIGLPQNLQNILYLMPQQQMLHAFLDARIEWDIFRINLLKFMQDYDLILCPVAKHTALPHEQSLIDEKHFNGENYLIPYSLMGWPAAVVPVGFSSKGLPIAVQCVAHYQHDYTALYAALVIENELK